MNQLSILDKYILRSVFEIFILGVIIFTSIIFASETFTQLIKQISAYGIPFNIAVMMIILNLPQVFVMTIPISTLFAVVMTLNRLSLNSEITVLRSCGIGIARIARPVLVFSVVMALAGFLINELVVPATTKQSRQLALYSLQKKHVPEGKMNFTLKELNEGNQLKRLFYVQACKDKTLKNITILDLSRTDTIQLIQAKAGRTDDLGWKFEDGVIYTLSTVGKIFNTTLFESSTINFGLENMENMIKESGNQYSFFKLAKMIRQNKYDKNFIEKFKKKYQIELYDKLALPMTTVSLALVGIPLAITPPRVRYNRGFLFSVLIIFVYYVIRAFSINLGETGAIPPFLAAWLPVVSIFVVGYILFYKKAYKIS
ncbi:lipopolysaccharide export system permease protein [Candidatus Gastranaerophilus sp. (ex Termes propinquus)]|nr:lipopolysaccharide export system permease protein [Candidatus Gastranaerophilus sp. (ex Termes propinquus)]